MARVSAIQTAFNNGVVSPYLYGRIDVEKASLSVRELQNFLVLPQGPLTKRDGSRFVVPVADETKNSWLFEFEFSPTQSYIVEMNDTTVRFFTNRGIVLETAKAVTAITQANPAVVTSTSHGFANGDHVLFPAVGPYSALANRVFTVVNQTTNTFELSGFDGTALPAFSGSPTVARVYEIDPPAYDADDIPDLYVIQSADVLYLFHSGYQTRTLTRSGATNWAFAAFDFKDGPYLTEDTQGTTLTPADYGSITPTMSSNTTPSGTVASLDGSASAYKVFDRDPSIEYIAGDDQGWVSYEPSSARVADSYWIVATSVSTQLDRAPTAWTFEGYDGSNWVVLDRREGETGWATNERRFYKFGNTHAYDKYRFKFAAVDGSTIAQIAEIGIHQSGDTQTAFTLTASATAGINGGAGFQSNDVGRAIRLMGSDGRWRWAKIDSVTDTTHVNVKLYDYSLPDKSPISRWQLGMFCEQTGWPSCGVFFKDRLIVSGPTTLPYYIVGSVAGVYTTFTPSDEDGTVTAESGFAYALIERQVSAIRWMDASEHGVIIGTAAGEAVLNKAATNDSFSALNIEVTWPTSYGSANVRPQRADVATLFVQRAGKRVREFAFVFTEDSFRAPDLTIQADHITDGGITRSALQKHPRMIYWALTADGDLIGMTYNREQNVVAWHGPHTIGGTDVEIEDIAVIPSSDGASEDLWLVVKRTIDGATHRYVEFIADPFSHDTEQEDAVFVDSALVYDGAATDTITGLHHLEGQTVRALIDGIQADGLTVSNGSVTLPREGEKVVVGLGYKARMRTLPLNAGGAEGTSQGKLKRIFRFVMRLYRALGGQYGANTGDLAAIPYNKISQSLTLPLPLFSGDTDRLPWPGGWESDGSVVVENDTAYPFTLTAMMPRVDTEDGG